MGENTTSEKLQKTIGSYLNKHLGKPSAVAASERDVIKVAPIVHGYYNKSENSLWCKCPFCKHWHNHSNYTGLRLSHCQNIKNRGIYFLYPVGALTPQIKRKIYAANHRRAR